MAAAPEAVWQRAYADVGAWAQWNPELAAAEGPFEAGASVKVRFRTGLRLRFRIIELDDGRVFTDEARLPFARMGHRHLVEPAARGSLLTNTIYIEGPLAPFWRRVLGPRAASALPGSQREIERIAGSS